MFCLIIKVYCNSKFNRFIMKYFNTQKFIVITTVLFIAEILAVHLVYPNFDPLSTPLSLYATGPYWIIITSGLVLIGTNYLLLFFQSGRPFQNNIPLTLGRASLIIAAVSTYGVALFPTDLGSVATITGKIHLIAAHTHFAAIPCCALLFYAGLQNDTFVAYRKILLGFFITVLGAGLSLILKNSLLISIKPLSGLLQKLLIIEILLWIIISAVVFSRYRCSVELSKAESSKTY